MQLQPANTASSSSIQKASKRASYHVTTQSSCPVCKGSHRIYQCDKFHNWTQERMNVVRKTKLCFNCLQQFSQGHSCSVQTCRKCNRRHHTLLHGAKSRQSTIDSATTPPGDDKSNLLKKQTLIVLSRVDQATTFC